MRPPALENIVASLNYADLPETWRVPEVHRFSADKTLYDYQTDALSKAARALFLYYGKEHDWIFGEAPEVNVERKRSFAGLYGNSGTADLKRYERPSDERNRNENQVFRILSDFITPQGDLIPRHHTINRMCFWMATGSGKTLVMVKLIEYLRHLQQHGEIPPHNILILAPSDHLIGQIRHTIDEFNQADGLQIEMMPLRQAGKVPHQRMLGDSVTVYYHRSDNISDVSKEALTDYRIYENGGKWYVLLDEAHKGGKDESKRQAYYVLMAREGFLFNFSATFTDEIDIVTTVKKYNLEEFTKNGYGKNIFLNEPEYRVFQRRAEEISHAERRKIVLKSLITLAFLSMRVAELRRDTGFDNLYHSPLMLTLVNSVNTDVKNEKNDLWAFFQTLREIATGEIDELFFKDVKQELINDWRDARLLFGEDGAGIVGADEGLINTMKITDLRAAVFLARRKGALQFIKSSDNKELAFQIKNADSPFALIRIGDTSKWRNEILAGYEETTALQEKSFFDGLEQSSITILMGSRTFFESWDSNRPNVINFINIGGKDAKKFVVQSVGRGVRIEPMKNKRRRLAHLLSTLTEKEKTALDSVHARVAPLETLFLFATNRDAVKNVLEGLQSEKSGVFERVEGFVLSRRPKINGREMPLLIPEYKVARNQKSERSDFAMSESTLGRFKQWLERTSDSVFVVRDNLSTRGIADLREMGDGEYVKQEQDKVYANIPFLKNRLLSYFSETIKVSDGVRELDGNDIVHFREIRIRSDYANEFQAKVDQVKAGELSDTEMDELVEKYAVREITKQAFGEKMSGKNEGVFKELTIKRISEHYYLPVVTGDEKANYIQHIVKVASEINFLNALEDWVGENKNAVPWDAWMFSKVDESLDKIHIPYFDASNNYRNFSPDFVFWMCRKNEYRIVFVDPKGTEHTDAYRKIDGYKKLFVENNSPRVFEYESGWLQVRVELLMFNEPDAAAKEYRGYWTDEPKRIFQVA